MYWIIPSSQSQHSHTVLSLLRGGRSRPAVGMTGLGQQEATVQATDCATIRDSVEDSHTAMCRRRNAGKASTC